MTQHTQLRTSDRWRMLLVALTVTLAMQVMRPFFVLDVYNFGERNGLTLAAIPALIVFLAPFATPLLVRLFNTRVALFLSIGGLAVLRVVMQLGLSAEVMLILAGVASALALMALPLGLIWIRSDMPTPAASGYMMTVGIILGLTLDTALNSAFMTWDYLWQPGIIPLILALVLSAGVFVALAQINPHMVTEPFDSDFRTLLPSALIGPFFMLQMLFLQNVPFVASATGLPLFAASGVVLLGDAFALLGFSLTLELRATPILRVFTLVGFTALVYLLPMVSGPLAVAILLVTLVWSGGLLFAALSTGTPAATTPGVSRTSVVLGIGSLLFIFPAILFYISQQIAIPIPGAILPPFAGLLLGLAAFALMHEVEASPHEWWTRAVPLIALIIPVALFLTRPAIDTVTPSDAGFRLVNYNIHQAINTDGWVNPEAIAKVIEDEGADVVVLQEVTRGWLISGSLDIAEWLSARLGMPYYFAPAADGQFGNAILSRFPVSEWNFAPLPTEDLPMARSFFRAVIDTGVDESITIIGTHLSAFTDVVHRLPQIDALLSAWDGAPRTIITGDMNSHPDEADINRLLDAGLTSAGDPTIPTFISFDPTERIDYIFASEDLIFADFGVGSTTASDHLPLAVNVHYGE